MELDNRLKKHSSKLAQLFDLANEYKKNHQLLQKKWWWQLDEYPKQFHPWNRFDGITSGIRVSVWTFNIALLGTLVSRLIGSSSGIIGAVAIAISTFIPILQAKSELTQSGQESFNDFLRKRNIPQYLYEEAKLLSTLLSTALLLFLWHFLPLLVAQSHYRIGAIKHDQGKFKEAEVHYLKAIDLNPDIVPVYDNLGYIYEVAWHDIENAEKYYFVGVKGNYISSYSHLGRLYLLDNKHTSYEALVLLEKGLSIIEQEESRENITDEEKEILFQQKYSFYKNIGWAKLKQESFKEAANFLGIAKSILDQLEKDGNIKYIKSPGSVYCLLAQLPQNHKLDSYQYWEKCKKLIELRLAADVILPEEDKWISQAKEALKENKND